MSTPDSIRPLLFDSHAHLVADDQARYPRNPMQRAADAPYRPPGVIGRPGGQHGPNPINEVPDALRMLRWMEEENVDGIVAVQKRMIYRYDNSYILDSSDRYPELFSAVVILDAEDPATSGLVRTWIDRHGLAGVRLFGGRKPDGSMPWLNSPMALKTWEVAQQAGLVMDLEVLSQGGGGPSIPSILELARDYPDVRIVLDHLLEPEMEEGAHFGLDERYEKLAGRANIFFKFTSINLDICREAGIPAEKVLRRAVDMFGADHIMWGSDIGTSSGTYEDMVQRMLDASVLLNPQEQRAVWHDTGRRVFVKGGVKAQK
ncbi:Predicted metal-dependent hydrolase, TIM-barrel fold [Variovorax sp. HW608]|uniref:amidohydrolase family protein n=1 Tax=Variovorax sp. HW608 TaxID=1034889 RepID=UPI00082018E8|nr:amidohydrolase family protein [Variovorax sp. HW608]SCK35144.1 Predicted metal-dependent hydrolase, TIM-barrel fold [Variovorax sp. HW608]